MTKHYAEPASKQKHWKQQNGTLGMSTCPASLWDSDRCSCMIRFLKPYCNQLKHVKQCQTYWILVFVTCLDPQNCPWSVRVFEQKLPEWNAHVGQHSKTSTASVKTDLFFSFSSAFPQTAKSKNDRNSLKFGADQDFWIWRNSTNRGVNQSNQSEPTSVSLSKPSAALLKPKAMPEATCGQSGQSGQSLGSRLSWLKRGCESLWVTAFWWSLGGDVVLLFNFLCLAALNLRNKCQGLVSLEQPEMPGSEEHWCLKREPPALGRFWMVRRILFAGLTAHWDTGFSQPLRHSRLRYSCMKSLRYLPASTMFAGVKTCQQCQTQKRTELSKYSCK